MRYSIVATDDSRNSWRDDPACANDTSADSAALRFAAMLLHEEKWKSTRLTLRITQPDGDDATIIITRAGADTGDQAGDTESEAHPS